MGKRVMVVDDSRLLQMQMQKLLESTDYEVAAYCKDGEEAVARYGEVLPDVMTLDIIMPGMDGLETAREILEKYPEAKIIMMSSLAYEEAVEEAKAIGAKEFIYKPLEPKEVLATLDRVVAET